MQLENGNIFVDTIVGHSENFPVVSLDFYKNLKVFVNDLSLNCYNLCRVYNLDNVEKRRVCVRNLGRSSLQTNTAKKMKLSIKDFFNKSFP